MLNNGKVGIGTIAPSSRLDVHSANIDDLNLYQDTGGLRSMTTDAAAIGKGGVLHLGGSHTGTTNISFVSLRGGLETVGSSSGYLGIYMSLSGTGSVERMRITSTGNVGIGTPTPGSKLEVVGDGKFTGLVKLSDGYTVATLPAGTVGQRAYVTDALAPAFLAALVGGGAVNSTAFRNGTVWVAG
jgi:hypothetical protein